MLPSSRAARLLPHLARSAVTAAAPKKIWQKSTVARASPTPAATPAKRTITRNATPSRAALIVEDAGMDAPLPEIPATSALAASPDISPPNAAVMQQQPILDSSAPSPAVPASPPPVASSSTIAAIKSFPSTSGFPSQSIPTPAAPTATPVHQPVPFSVPVEQRQVDWVTSFHGMSAQPFSDRAADALMRPLLPTEIEIKPDGIVYLPEIQYRRILNKAFGPGGWGLVPRGEMTIMKGLPDSPVTLADPSLIPLLPPTSSRASTLVRVDFRSKSRPRQIESAEWVLFSQQAGMLDSALGLSLKLRSPATFLTRLLRYTTTGSQLSWPQESLLSSMLRLPF
ncbi:hypothetical protein P7C70_g7088, partial [Phenoliferia sp. Uapishka_3]